MRLFLATGILGGFTTFSAFSLDAVLLWERHEHLLAALYVGGSVAGAIAGLVLGLWIMRTVDGVSTRYDVIVAGGGAAGLMCALRAGQRGRRVLLLEHADKVGKKILISGGGRCNFTNLGSRPEAFLSANPHFCKSALARYTQHDFIALVEKHRIAWHEKTLGQLFCDGSARQIVAMLLGGMRRCRRRGEGGAPHHRHRQGRSFHRGDGPRRVHVAVAGARDGRLVDSQDGRDGLRARRRPPLRPSSSPRRGRHWCR